MTIIYQGIRRKTTDVLDDYGQAHYLQNVRLKRVGELARRAGLGKSTMAQQAGPVQFMIGAWSNVPFVVNGTGGTVTGQEDPLPLWTAATMRLPTGIVGQPAAPVITGVTFTPLSSTVQWTAMGTLSCDVQVTYDGLSGPLAYDYDWGQYWTVLPPGNGVFPNPADFDLSVATGGAFSDGTYTVTITVYPIANPLLFSQTFVNWTSLP